MEVVAIWQSIGFTYYHHTSPCSQRTPVRRRRTRWFESNDFQDLIFHARYVRRHRACGVQDEADADHFGATKQASDHGHVDAGFVSGDTQKKIISAVSFFAPVAGSTDSWTQRPTNSIKYSTCREWNVFDGFPHKRL